MSSVLPIVGGLAALTIGAELLVRGGTGLASSLGISTMVIGGCRGEGEPAMG